MKLIIVESPNKIHTISKIMGPDYTVMATAGHIMKIDSVGPYRLGIDTKNDFKVSYIFDPAKKELLKVYSKKIKRAGFDSITADVVKKAIENPVGFDSNMISASRTRQILDRLIGYRLSPIALSKIGCESAGRVQSALLQLICKKEEEIKKFKSKKYFDVFIDGKKGTKLYTAKLSKIKKKKVEKIESEDVANECIDSCNKGSYIVSSITKKEALVEPKLPLTTAALQQLASNKLSWSPAKTQETAQKLFESGITTYPRVDSIRLSDDFIASAKEYITKTYGKEYYRGLNIPKEKNKDAQDAHESIRPTDIKNAPEKAGLSGAEAKLYELIYKYTLASFFVPAKVENTQCTIKNGDYEFSMSGKTIVFASFLDIVNDVSDLKILPNLKEGEECKIINIYSEEKETQPPQRYSEAGLVSLMQTTGIGRPSTFSSTIETLKKREYISIEKKAVFATEKGMRLNKMLQEYFSSVINSEYTSLMEDTLDSIAKNEKKELETLEEFWKEFEPILLKATREINKTKEKPESVGQNCPKCGKELVYRFNKKHDKFICCSAFPKCRFTASSLENLERGKENVKKVLNISCPKCGEGQVIKRVSKAGDDFYACTRFPKCRFTMNPEKFASFLEEQSKTNKDN